MGIIKKLLAAVRVGSRELREAVLDNQGNRIYDRQIEDAKTTIQQPVRQELRELVSLIKTLELNVEVVNKPVPGMDKVLSVMGDAINNSLLPVVQAMEHKLKMDHDIWDRVKQMGEQIQSLEKSIVKSYRTQRRLAPDAETGRKN
jgi:hypothetical protein